MCHNPHTQVKPEDALKSCTTAGCHGDWRKVPFHTGAAHRASPSSARPATSRTRPGWTRATARSAIRRWSSEPLDGVRPPQPFDTTEALQRVSLGATVYLDIPPPDTFSHPRHRTLACLTCHVPNAPRSRLTFERPRGCQICHHQASATSRCAQCHESAELAEPIAAAVTVTVEAATPAAAPRERSVPFSHPAHAGVPLRRLPLDAGDARAAGLGRPACVSCHVQHHEPARTCASCHRTDATLPAHAKLDDAHAACTSCHAPATVARARAGPLLLPELPSGVDGPLRPARMQHLSLPGGARGAQAAARRDAGRADERAHRAPRARGGGAALAPTGQRGGPELAAPVRCERAAGVLPGRRARQRAGNRRRRGADRRAGLARTASSRAALPRPPTATCSAPVSDGVAVRRSPPSICRSGASASPACASRSAGAPGSISAARTSGRERIPRCSCSRGTQSMPPMPSPAGSGGSSSPRGLAGRDSTGPASSGAPRASASKARCTPASGLPRRRRSRSPARRSIRSTSSARRAGSCWWAGRSGGAGAGRRAARLPARGGPRHAELLERARGAQRRMALRAAVVARGGKRVRPLQRMVRDLRARARLHRPRPGRDARGARQYRPFFPLWTIWGVFSPSPYRAAHGPSASRRRAACSSPPRPSTSALPRPRPRRRSCGWITMAGAPASAQRMSRPTAGASRPATGSSTARAHRATGSTRASAWRGGRGVTLSAYGAALTRPLEFRLSQSELVVLGADAAWQAQSRLRIALGAAHYAETRDRPDAAAFDGTSCVLHARVTWLLASAPDARRCRPRSAAHRKRAPMTARRLRRAALAAAAVLLAFPASAPLRAGSRGTGSITSSTARSSHRARRVMPGIASAGRPEDPASGPRPHPARRATTAPSRHAWTGSRRRRPARTSASRTRRMHARWPASVPTPWCDARRATRGGRRPDGGQAGGRRQLHRLPSPRCRHTSTCRTRSARPATCRSPRRRGSRRTTSSASRAHPRTSRDDFVEAGHARLARGGPGTGGRLVRHLPRAELLRGVPRERAGGGRDPRARRGPAGRRPVIPLRRRRAIASPTSSRRMGSWRPAARAAASPVIPRRAAWSATSARRAWRKRSPPPRRRARAVP